MLQETVTHWYDEERALGRSEGEESILKNLRVSIMQMLASRFGVFPGAWGALLEAVNEPDIMVKLVAGIYQVSSTGEYEAMLRNAAGSCK